MMFAHDKNWAWGAMVVGVAVLICGLIAQMQQPQHWQHQQNIVRPDTMTVSCRPSVWGWANVALGFCTMLMGLTFLLRLPTSKTVASSFSDGAVS